MDILKFAIGDGDELNIVTIRNILQSKGHVIVCEESDGPSLLRKIRSVNPDFVILGYNIPGINASEIVRIIEEDSIAPVLIIADNTEDIFIREMGNEYFPYIIKPISQAQLLTIIEIIYNNFKRITDLRKEVLKLNEMLETRKIVERAKGILIDNFKMKEKDAFRYIQKRSMDECKPIIDIAKRIIEKQPSK